MKLLKIKQVEIYFATTLGKQAGSVALVSGFCWCLLKNIYQFKFYFLCFEIVVYWNQASVSKANTKQAGGQNE